MPEALYVAVFLDQNLTKALDYSVPEEWRSIVEVGMRVEVPLRRGTVKGTIAMVKQGTDFSNTRPISKVLSARGELAGSLWKLAEWMSRYYATPFQKVLRCFIPPHVRKEVKRKPKQLLTLALSGPETIKACEELRAKKPERAALLEKLLQEKKGILLADCLRELAIPRSAIAALIKKKWISSCPVLEEEEFLLDEEFFPTQPKTLNEEQSKCLEIINTSLDQEAFSTHLIYGVTGSGKTEIYLQAIDRALKKGKSAIMLVPEISLTSQTIERFRARYSEKIAILHHRRSLGERSSAWEDLRSGRCRIAIGARSAIFCPIQNLGLIIVDEEHDSSYKQSDEAPCYQGRDVAVMRGHLEKGVVLLGSATPSIESRYNAACGKYTLHTLCARATSAPLPNIQIVDMKKAMEIAGGFTHFSHELIDAMKERMKAGEQTLLFLNKRGYHRMQLCSKCRAIAKCPHCDLSLTYHRESNHLKCHLCSYIQPHLRSCAACGSSESLEFKGFGTEHVERSLHALFPEVRTLRMDKDTTQKKNSHEELFKQFRAHKADVLIGTQMIAKGFHFPSVTLVGVLNLDASLSIPDFRSPEQVFQLLIQVAGRAGRSHLPGHVIFQTFLPDHPIIRLAAGQDYDAFYTSSIEERRLFGYPPFCHLVKLLFTGETAEKAEQAARCAHTALSRALSPPSVALPVAPAGHPKIQDLYRFQFLIKTPRIALVEPALRSLDLAKVKVDVDPLSTFF